MSNELATTDIQAETLEKVLISGDLAKLTPAQRVNYYNAVCQSIGLNPLTKPFEYITLNNKLTLYAKKDATEQLRTKHQISITGLEKSIGNDMITVTAYAQNGAGRTDADIGVVAIRNQQGDALANSMMKAVTKAKRRVTLSICGLGWLDESELETIPSAKQVVITEDGEIIDEEPDYEPPQAPPGDTPEEQLLNAPDPEPAKNGNGKAKFAGNVADARAWLEEKIKDNKVVLGIVCDALAMTGLYNGREHVKSWLDGDFEDAKALRDAGLDTDLRKNVTGKGALKIFDAGVARKEPAEEG